MHDFTPRGVSNIDWTWPSSAMPDAGITDEFKPLDYFKFYFDEYLMNIIVCETNKYGNYIKTTSTARNLEKWVDVFVGELYVFLGVCMLMPHN